MTSRLFLTLLALLTGLSVQGTSVQARVATAQRSEVGAIAAMAEERQTRLAESLPCAVGYFPAVPNETAQAASIVEAGPRAPGVLTRIDRARE